jgi:exosortase A-associated hydrolase 2
LTGPNPFFLEGTAGALFCLHYPARQPARHGVLVLPPFAEEMNKCRRMLGLTARAIQRAGLDVLLVDLFGTGDSAGDFSDASLEVWRDDLRRTIGWLAERGIPRLDLLAVRGGALLLQALELPIGMRRGRIVLWQPIVSGKLLVSQFLRVRAAEGMADADRGRAGPDTRASLQARGSIEVAGYEISRSLVSQLEDIADPLAEAANWQALSWLEVVAEGVAEPGPAAQRALDRLRQRGATVHAAVVPGDPFWATPEIAVVPRLVDATVGAFAEPGE